MDGWMDEWMEGCREDSLREARKSKTPNHNAVQVTTIMARKKKKNDHDNDNDGNGNDDKKRG